MSIFGFKADNVKVEGEKKVSTTVKMTIVQTNANMSRIIRRIKKRKNCIVTYLTFVKKKKKKKRRR